MGQIAYAGLFKEVTPVIVGTDEAVERLSYVLDDTSTNILSSPALLKIKSAATSGDIKVTLAGKNRTVIVLSSDDVNEANIHVVKVWGTGTDLATTDFLLWQ